MGKLKSVFRCIFITFTIWTVSRFVPSFLNAIFQNTVIYMLFALGMLPLGWYLACLISKGRNHGCIRTNISIFGIIEALGLISALTRILDGYMSRDMRYTTDMYGVAYSDYLAIYGTMIIGEIVYLAVCYYLYKKTPETPNIVKVQEKQMPIEKNHDEKQKLRDEIAKLKMSLKECDATYENNKKILSESYTDDQLKQMVSNGEFPADRVSEYISQREGLETIVNLSPQIRATTINLIGDLTKQLAELECE